MTCKNCTPSQTPELEGDKRELYSTRADSDGHDTPTDESADESHGNKGRPRTAEAREADERRCAAITEDPFVQDAIIESITTLEGISQALGYRVAVFHDEMLELLSRAAADQANELRDLLDDE